MAAAVQPLLDRAVALRSASVSRKLIAGKGSKLGRTLVIREAIAPGDVLVKLPLSELLNRSAAETDSLVGQAFSSFRKSDGANELCSLTLYLTCLRAAPDVLGGGRWSAYLAALPEDCPTPLGWDKETLSLLCRTQLAAAVEQQVAVVNELYALWWPKLLARVDKAAMACGVGEALELVKQSDVLHAYAMVASRAFSVPFPDGSAPLCLIPLVDMLDHSHAVNVEYATSKAEEGSGGEDTFCLIAKSVQAEGQPLWINYGSCKSNSELLVQHGFAVPGNPADRFSSSMRMRSSDGMAPAIDLAIVLRSAGLKLQQELSLVNPLPAAMLHVTALLHLPPQCAYFLAARALEIVDADTSEPGTPVVFPGDGNIPASPFQKLSRGGGLLEMVASVGSPQNKRRTATINSSTKPSRRPPSPLFSSVLLSPSFKAEDLPFPLVRPVISTLTCLLNHELQRCESVVRSPGVVPKLETLSTTTTGSSEPVQAMALYLAGQVDILRASLAAATAWEERMHSSVATLIMSSTPEHACVNPLLTTTDLGLWHELHLEVPPEREQLLQLSEVGTTHWLPLLLPEDDDDDHMNGDDDDEDEESMASGVGFPSTVSSACWNRLLIAATVCTVELSVLEECGAPALLSCAARVEAASAHAPLLAESHQAAAADSLVEVAAAFRAGVGKLLACPSVDTVTPSFKSPEVLLLELLEAELAQVERWRNEVHAEFLSLKADDKECREHATQDAEEELQQLNDSLKVLKSWTSWLARIARLHNKNSLLNSRKRTRSVV